MKFTEPQHKQIQYGKDFGLTNEQISIYAKPVFNERQMENIRIALEENVDASLIAHYCIPELSAEDIEIITWAIRDNFNEKEMQALLESEESDLYVVYDQIVRGKYNK